MGTEYAIIYVLWEYVASKYTRQPDPNGPVPAVEIKRRRGPPIKCPALLRTVSFPIEMRRIAAKVREYGAWLACTVAVRILM